MVGLIPSARDGEERTLSTPSENNDRGYPSRVGALRQTLTSARWSPWRWKPVRDATPALLVYAGIRVLGLIVLFVVTRRSGDLFLAQLWSEYDAPRYRDIAANGYPSSVPVDATGKPLSPSSLAFFPLYPALMWLVHAVTFLPLTYSGLLVAWVAGLAAAWGIFAVGREVGGRTVGITLAALWAVYPHAIVENMAYSETLFTALAAWTLYAVLRRQWLAAGIVCLLAGVTRPTANALIAAVGIAALIALFRRQDGRRPWLAILLAPLGYLGYLAFVAIRLGRIDGYFYIQSATWARHFDFGAHAFGQIVKTMSNGSRLAEDVTTFMLFLAALMLVLSVGQRIPLPLLIYGGVTLAFIIGTAGGYHGDGRYLLPAFTLLLPIATGLALASRFTRWTVIAFLAGISTWYGVYLCLVWAYSP